MKEIHWPNLFFSLERSLNAIVNKPYSEDCPQYARSYCCIPYGLLEFIELMREITTLKSVAAGSNFMDLGCSVGVKCKLANYVFEFNTFGIDFNPEAIELARKMFQETSFTEGDFFEFKEIYNDIDIFYTYQPLIEATDMFSMLDHVFDNAKKGAKILYIPIYAPWRAVKNSKWEWEEYKWALFGHKK